VRFSNHVVLVSGGAHGIGRATVERLAAEEARVAVCDLDGAAADELVAGLDPGRALAVRTDVRDRHSVDNAVAACVAYFGRLDTLVTVAGGAQPLPTVAGVSDDDWNAELDLNLTGTMRCVRAAIPHLSASRTGSIVAVSSVNGLAAFGDEPYSSAKAGISQLARNLAVQLGPQGVRVNVVAPATIRTRVWDSQGGPDKLAPFYPLGRVGEPAEVAAAIAFLASGDASWITGITLPVDGGVLAGPIQSMRLLLGG
jgi:meso-butanediol dehydrogenase / (S,S)-butanediol dehydrogenase / diacetyl reductase